MPAVADTLELGLDELKSHPQNARTHDLAVILRAIVARRAGRGKHTILAGHGTWEAARELGWERLLVHLIDCDAEQAKRILLVDNRANDHAGYDQRALLELLGGLPDLEGTGYDEDAVSELDALVQRLDPAERPPDAAPPVPTEPTTKPGDLYQLGEHRLLCGDSTVATHVERLMGGGLAAMVFTDPPYGIAYGDVKHRHRPIANDDAPPRELVRDSLALFGLKQDTPIYVCCDWRSIADMREALDELGLAPKACIVWDKQRGVQNLDRYHKQHELILYAGPYGGERTLRGDVWAVDREPNPGDHPTPKPVELVATAVEDATIPGSLVADPFGGSGTTLLACEQLARCAYLMELDPRYCDVIVKRWEEHTGLKAELVEA